MQKARQALNNLAVKIRLALCVLAHVWLQKLLVDLEVIGLLGGVGP